MVDLDGGTGWAGGTRNLDSTASLVFDASSEFETRNMNARQSRALTALPVYNEAQHVGPVLDEVMHYCRDILVVNDGSTDGTAARLADYPNIHVLTHSQNRGYGAALRSAFQFAIENKYEVLVTIDCDGQHEPQRIGAFIDATREADVVSGSRYLQSFAHDTNAPHERRRVNQCITALLNDQLGMRLTDAFCGFKAYRTAALEKLDIRENGYAMPLELWVQAVVQELRIKELPVPLIYLEEERSFGGALDNAKVRLQYYRELLDRCITQANLEVRPADPMPCGGQRG